MESHYGSGTFPGRGSCITIPRLFEIVSAAPRSGARRATLGRNGCGRAEAISAGCSSSSGGSNSGCIPADAWHGSQNPPRAFGPARRAHSGGCAPWDRAAEGRCGRCRNAGVRAGESQGSHVRHHQQLGLQQRQHGRQPDRRVRDLEQHRLDHRVGQPGQHLRSAAGRTTWSGTWSAQVFYARNVAAGTNTVDLPMPLPSTPTASSTSMSTQESTRSTPSTSPGRRSGLAAR